MEVQRRIVTYKLQKQLSNTEIGEFQNQVSQIEGVLACDIDRKSVVVDYITMKSAEEAVRELFSQYGCLVSVVNKKRPRIKRFIERLAESNKESFGNQRLDCCNLKH